jgi:hypothetical protein
MMGMSNDLTLQQLEALIDSIPDRYNCTQRSIDVHCRVEYKLRVFALKASNSIVGHTIKYTALFWIVC